MTQKEVETEISKDKSKKVESVVELTKTQISQTEQNISDETKKLTDKKSTSEQINAKMKEVYKTEIQSLSTIKMTPENTVLLLDKIRDLKESVFAIDTKSMNKEQIKKFVKNLDEKKKNRNLFELYTSAIVKNRNVWLPISEQTLVANSELFIKDSVGINSINDILNNNTTNSYIHTLCDKTGIELIQKAGGQGFKSIKNRTPEELLSNMTDSQKEAIAKLLQQ